MWRQTQLSGRDPGVAHTVPFMRGCSFRNGSCAADGCSRLFLHLVPILSDTWRTNRMILDLDSRFPGGSVSEPDDRITEGSKT